VGAAGLLGWLALSAVLPGAAHLRAGWRRTGLTLLGCYVAGLLGLLAWALVTDNLLGSLVDDTLLVAATLAATVLGVAWFFMMVHAFVVLRPSSLRQGEQIVTGTLAGLLTVAVLAPFAVAAQNAWIAREALNSIFLDVPIEPQAQGERPVTRSRDPWDPWAGRDRVTILLLGGDADDDRPGVRTDSMNVASIDVRTGGTVLFSLPRNLENVRFKPGTPMAARFPAGFRLPTDPGGGRSDLLNSVWEYADAHPEIFGGRKHQGAKVLMETIGHTLGVDIDWYALVNMWGFARLIDAIGGVTIRVEQDVVFGLYNEGLVRAGTRKLKGADAMWYARSRTNTDDYIRMRRQRCVIGALLNQADPATVLARFTRIAAATKELIQTDIPRGMLEHLVPLALKVQDAEVRSIQFMPPLINTGSPDWGRIRRLSQKAIRESRGTVATPADPSADPSASTSAITSEVRSPKRKKDADAAQSPAMGLTEGCGRV